MSKFVLIPGAGGMAWYWHRVVPELTARGHQAVAVDLPGDDESVGLPEYAVKTAAHSRDVSFDVDLDSKRKCEFDRIEPGLQSALTT